MSQDDPSASRSAVTPVRLDGWKDISAYLHRSIRTVQRWERESGLPVHRYPTRRGESVYAIAAELDAWLQTASAAAAVQSNGDADAVNGGNADAAEASMRQAAQTATARGEDHTSHASRRRVSRPLLLGVLAALAIAGAHLRWWLPQTPEPTRVRVEGQEVVALDAFDKPVWKYALDRPAQSSAPPGRSSFVVDDLDGDSHREVVVALTGRSGDFYEVACFDSHGRRRWTRHPDRAVHYEQKLTGPPWVPFFLESTGHPDRRSLWVSWVSTLNSGGFVERLNVRTGEPDAFYWNPGFVTAVAVGKVAGRSVLLLGGDNNEHEGASLAVYDLATPAGTGPASTAKFTCTDCPTERPLAFFVFPKTALSRAVLTDGAPFDVQVIKPHVAGFGVTVNHAPLGWGYTAAGALYYLDEHLRITGAETLDGYHVVHRELEAKGKLTTPYSKEEDGQLFPVLSWDGAKFVKIAGPQK